MATRRQAEGANPPATTPGEATPFYGSGDHSWTLQAIMDLKGSMGEIKSSLGQVQHSLDGIKAKVDDLVNWKHRIPGGVIVLGVVFSVGGFVVGKFWDYFTIKAPPSVQPQAQVPQEPQPSAKAPQK